MAGPEAAAARDLARRAASLLSEARSVQAKALSRGEDAAAQVAQLYRDAIAALEEAKRIDPALAAASRWLGIARLDTGELEEAVRELELTRDLEPGNSENAVLLAGALQALGRTQEAIACFEGVLRADPQHARAHAGLALSLLGAGDYERGWAEYEWRLELAGDTIYRPYPFPFWRGEPLEGKSILISSEQGIGDEIMFASCYQEVIDRARECVIECSTRLAPLFARSFPRARVIARNLSRMPDWSSLPAFDYHLPCGSLPLQLRRRAGDFPRRRAYLAADPERVGHWRERLAALGPGKKVGLAWRGGLAGTLGAARSLELAALEPLLAVGGVRFVSLEFSRPQGGPPWWAEATRSVDESAALVAALDLVVSVTTAIAHVAGALGTPLWLLVPRAATWRYGWSGETMPWYPQARILRGRGDVHALMERAAAELQAFVARG